ncbi:acetate/propionate family kinase [Amycolatopsis cihanbeyliensis]|uniref:Acetate kinase n=1 Tax=Amycolatopsis cihanbeyliensis TaxID=1128664 RepID=A0A542DE01_AMYCI|nr:acetate kinase [Amycolatopsis cihanbeyliensis]TQJ01301.1 acetate kinase [Amycolatopsis cihanbeyliensis]
MRVLTLNPGSASLKVALVDGEDVLAADGGDAAIRDAIRRWGRPDAVAVRFVHGGPRRQPVVLDDQELARLARLVPLAPLHQPQSLRLATWARKLLPDVPVVAAFDTAFHAGLPEAAARYALPTAWTRRHGIRRYGFHGLSCAYALRRTARLLDRVPDALRMVCCHLGSGVSVTAIRHGASVDTSMGFTPVEGAVMASRAGSVDPGLLLHLLRTGVTDVDELTDVLYHRSGLAGMTATSGDIREVLAACGAGDADAETAVEVYLHRLRREIGAAVAGLDLLDAVVFTGGVAEHQPVLLGRLLDGLAVLGLHADRPRLAAAGDRLISPAGRVPVLLVAAREELELARHAELLLATEPARQHRGEQPCASER